MSRQKSNFRQRSFSTGEVTPLLYGRDDIEGYNAALRTCENFFITRHGAAISRPGTKWIGTTKKSLYGPILIPYLYDKDTTYILEFGGTYFRVLKNGVYVISGGLVYEKSIDYVPTDIRHAPIRYLQVGDYLYIVQDNVRPKQIVRVSDTDWQVSDISFDLQPFLAIGGVYLEDPVPTTSTGNLAYSRPWKYVVTVVGKWLESGEIFETAGFEIVESWSGTASALPSRFVVAPDAPQKIITNPANGLIAIPGQFEILYLNIYRGQSEVLGWIGSFNFGEEFTDFGDEPDYLRPPPEGTHPFKLYSGTGTFVREEYPSVISMYQQRLVLGSTSQRRDRLWFSYADSFLNFDQPIPASDDSAVELALAFRTRERIVNILGLDALLVFTNESVYSITGANGPISPNGLRDIRLQSEVGSSSLRPLFVEGAVLYTPSRGSGVRELFYNDNRKSFNGRDLGFAAQHLFDGHYIKAWAYQQEPYGVIWAVRDDGVLLSLTYYPELSMAAWAKHTTDGIFYDVVCVPEGDKEAIYFVVDRGGNKQIEKMYDRRDLTTCVFTDCSIEQSNDPPSSTIFFPVPLNGKTLRGVADGRAFEISGGVGTATLPFEAWDVKFGLGYDAKIELLDVFAYRDRTKKVAEVWVDVVDTRGLLIGEDLDSLSEVHRRDTADDYDPLSPFTGRFRVRPRTSWRDHGRLIIVQRDALPATILGVDRVSDVGDGF